MGGFYQPFLVGRAPVLSAARFLDSDLERENGSALPEFFSFNWLIVA